jgi:hypothetical protein
MVAERATSEPSRREMLYVAPAAPGAASCGLSFLFFSEQSGQILPGAAPQKFLSATQIQIA